MSQPNSTRPRRAIHAYHPLVPMLALLAVPAVGWAHDDSQFEEDRGRWYTGAGYRNVAGGVPPIAFPADGIQLLGWLPIVEFDRTASAADDCWGYVSPSGREYALIGISTGTGFVEVTDAGDPQIIELIDGPDSTWRDIKVYQDHAYAVSEAGSGIQVFDLSQIDAGVVTQVPHLTNDGILGVSATHNVAINEQSGMLYRCGGGGGTIGLRIYSLADPDAPALVGEWHDAYVHDAQIVTWNSAPYAGQEIAFCFAGNTSSGGSPRVEILNVTDPANVTSITTVFYDNPAFCHQGWLSPDQQVLYVNDELDESNFGSTTTTRIIDVSDLDNAQQVGSFTNGNSAIDHNLYTVGNLIYEANYRSGLRIFDATDPLAPFEIAHFDTWPDDDNANFNGLWNTYPYLPSGIILGSDIEKGLFIWWVGEAELAFTYPGGLPSLLSPQGATISVQIDEQDGALLTPGTATLHYDVGLGYQDVPLVPVGGNLYDAVFPALPCGTEVSYYLSGETDSGIVWRDPATAPASGYSGFAADGETILVDDDFEADAGWTPANLGASSGDWQRGVPVSDPGWDYDPVSDSDGSGSCWLTQNEAGNTDVDSGAVELMSSTLDLSGGAIKIEYDYYLRMTNAAGTDRLLVEMSTNDAAGPWAQVALHESDGGLSWRTHAIDQADLDALGIVPGSTVRLRFTANDADPQSIVEAGVDALRVTRADCNPPGPASDFDGSGTVDVVDLLQLLAAWGPCVGCVEDLDGSGAVDVVDLLQLLGEWG